MGGRLSVKLNQAYGIYTPLVEVETPPKKERKFLAECSICGAKNFLIGIHALLSRPTHCQNRHVFVPLDELKIIPPEEMEKFENHRYKSLKAQSPLMKFTEEEWQSLIDQSNSYADLLKRVGKRDDRNSYKTLREILSLYPNLSYDKMKENAAKRPRAQEVPFEEVFKKGTTYSTSLLRSKLIKHGIKSFKKCECCGISSWQRKPIVIQLHHKDGDHTNNEIDNIAELCPNCHSQTETFSKRKKVEREEKIKQVKKDLKEKPSLPKIQPKKKKYYCPICGKEMSRKAKLCFECDAKRRWIESKRPSRDELIQAYSQTHNFCQLGRQYEVSDNTVRKWMKSYKIDYKNI